MSESEIESVFGESVAASTSRKITKRKKTPIASRSDSECETEPAVPKKKRASKSRVPSKNSKDLFGLLSDEEEALAVENSRRRSSTTLPLDSSLTSKVANGCVRRSASLSGAYYVEVRAYTTSDALKTPPLDRYKKALLTAKVQLNTGTAEWHDLQKLMRSIKKLFEDREPVFYSNKINIK